MVDSRWWFPSSHTKHIIHIYIFFSRSISKNTWGWDWDERRFFLLNNSNNSKEHLESPVAIGLPRPSVSICRFFLMLDHLFGWRPEEFPASWRHPRFRNIWGLGNQPSIFNHENMLQSKKNGNSEVPKCGVLANGESGPKCPCRSMHVQNHSPIISYTFMQCGAPQL